MEKTVVLLSGGMDSTTLLYLADASNKEVHALSFNYGQKHVHELAHAKKTVTKMDVPHTILNLDQVFTQFESNSALLSAQVSVPNGHYADESMRITVVPNRNMILLSVAIGFAISKGFNEVAYAAHSGDHAVYKDCTPEFLEPLSLAAKNCDWNPVTIWAPFLNITKTEIARIGNRLSVPWEDTYSCYNGQEIQCGTCGTCVERLEALRDAQL